MKFFGEPQLAIINCLTGERIAASKWPFIIGGGEACDLALDVNGSECEIAPSGRGHMLKLRTADGSILLNGSIAQDSLLKKEKNYSLKVGDHLFVFRLSKEPEKWFESVAVGRWIVYHKPTNATTGPYQTGKLAGIFSQFVLDGESERAAYLEGSNIGFFVESVRHIFDELSDEPSFQGVPESSRSPASEMEEEILESGQEGSLICPSCWLKFDPGQIKHIAKHHDLRGDLLLGEAEMMRFWPNRYTDKGVALDPMGVPAPDLACPHCHRRLPRSFVDIKHHIMSIVGAQTSGKSYFLCSMTRAMQKTMPRRFETAFIDADPRMNVLLTEMRDALFSARTPEEAVVAKTRLDGTMYEQLPRFGKMVPLPKPFIFNLQPQRDTTGARALIFYDNAGENFLPGVDLDRSPGIFHLASASGMLFMFDPAYSTDFRPRLRLKQDPQLEAKHTDFQASILAGIQDLVQKTEGLDANGRLSTPFAFMVGKFDLWRDLLPEDTLAEPVTEEGFDLRAIEENSAVTRKLLMEIAPQLVANAEAVSSNVKYFPVSPTGCSPKRIKNERGEDALSPDPSEISPFLVDAPVLWILSQIEPHLVPLRT